MISAYTSGRVAAFVFFTCLIYSGCSSTSRVVESPLSPSYNISREGLLRYKVPVGWFDATQDSQSVATEIWLVKNNYAATITVSRITVDAETRRAIDREGLARLAHLTMALAGETSSATLLQPPTLSTVNGRDVYSYVAVSPSSNDTTRVVLIDTGENVFEVIGLVPGNQRRVSSSEVFSAQESFLKSLRW